MNLSEAFAQLGLKEDADQPHHEGLDTAIQKSEYDGKSFDICILTAVADNSVYGLMQTFRCADDNQEECIAFAESMVLDAIRLYGDPDTYPGLADRILQDGQPVLAERIINNDLIEEWVIGQTKLKIRISCFDYIFMLSVTMQMKV